MTPDTGPRISDDAIASMAHCLQVVELLVDYVENRLPEGRRLELERHLAGCGSCLAALNTYRSTVSLLESLTEDDLPGELRTRLRAFLDRESAN